MSLPVFLTDSLASVGDTLTVTGPEGRHAVSVVRLGPGDGVVLVDGRGTALTCTVTAVSGKDQLQVVVDDVTTTPRPDPHVTIVQALPKSDRSELAVDLMTQGGVDVIVPWQASRSIARWAGKEAKAKAKWEAAAVAAAKQSRRATIPQVKDLVDAAGVDTLVADADVALLLHEGAATALREIDLHGDVVLVIGPEGGLSDEEVERFTASGARAVKLGPEVLRTASAGVVALAAIGVLSARW